MVFGYSNEKNKTPYTYEIIISELNGITQFEFLEKKRKQKTKKTRKSEVKKT